MPTSKYDTDVDLSRANNSHTLMVQLIGWNQDVLDVGCANGYLGRVLKEHGCNVVGIEIDPAAAEEAKGLLAEAGLAAVEFLRTTAGLFETELGIKPGDFRPEVVRAVESDPEARTYQFVVKAVVDDGDRSVRELHDAVESQREEIARLREQ